MQPGLILKMKDDQSLFDREDLDLSLDLNWVHSYNNIRTDIQRNNLYKVIKLDKYWGKEDWSFRYLKMEDESNKRDWILATEFFNEKFLKEKYTIMSIAEIEPEEQIRRLDKIMD